MAIPFLSSEEYDERAHRLYDEGEYDSALETLKEGLSLYPHSVELYVGMGYTRLARDEFAWARQAFERGLVLDPDHEDALVGLGDALLRFGEPDEAVRLFHRARETGAEDLDLMLSMGRALYRERLYEEAVVAFRETLRWHPRSADAAAGLGYTLHRLGDESGAHCELTRALTLDEGHHEARVYVAHLLYERGEWAASLEAFDHVPIGEHWDPLAIERVLELKRALSGGATEPEVAACETRLRELDRCTDPLDELLRSLAEPTAPDESPPHCVVLPHGEVVSGTWYEIVRRIRDMMGGDPGETVAQYMRRRSYEEESRSGRLLPAGTPYEFMQAGERAGLWHIER
jgi:tetratricopeptide (TPR) repeat protein